MCAEDEFAHVGGCARAGGDDGAQIVLAGGVAEAVQRLGEVGQDVVRAEDGNVEFGVEADWFGARVGGRQDDTPVVGDAVGSGGDARCRALQVSGGGVDSHAVGVLDVEREGDTDGDADRRESETTRLVTVAGDVDDPLDEDGHVPVPTGPGLGYEVDWDYVDANRVDGGGA